MKYELLIYAGNKTLTAYDISDKKNQFISMDGNDKISSDCINQFYENILDYYNVDDLSEISAVVHIINDKSSASNISFLMNKIASKLDFSIWRIEEVLPLIVIKNDVIKINDTVSVQTFDNAYMIKADSKFMLSVHPAKKTNNQISMEDYLFLTNIDGKLFSVDSNKMDDINNKLSVISRENEGLDKHIKQLEKEKTALSKELKRITDKKIELKKVIGDSSINTNLKKYISRDIKLTDYLIDYEITDNKNKVLSITIKNIKTNQYYGFDLSYKLDKQYTDERFKEDLYKKISKSLELMHSNYLYNDIRNSKFAGLNVDDVFEFGKYSSHKIKWRVLSKTKNKLYVISDDIVAIKKMNTSDLNEWKQSAIRKWLNNDFYNNSFTSGEKGFIIESNGDKIKLLSSEEKVMFLKKSNININHVWHLIDGSPVFEGLTNTSRISLFGFNGEKEFSLRPVLTIEF